jgi:glycosyltransferase involved in cell wall biosynthesis
MRILHLIDALDPERGGPPVVAACLAAAQASLGHQTSILAWHWEGADARTDQAMARVPGFGRVGRHSLGPISRLRFVLPRAASAALKAALSSADVLHIHGVWDPVFKAAASAARRRGMPYVVAPHGMLDPWSMAQKRLKKRIALALGFGRMLDRATFLHVLNADEGRLLAPLGLTMPLEVIPNGIFVEDVEPLPPAGEFHHRHSESAGGPYILFLSRLHYKKGLDFLADAFAQVVKEDSNVRLVVAGPDQGERANFESRVRDLGLTERVHLVGPLYGQDKLAALAGAACFVLPSRQEGFSVAVTEAMACRVPVVVSDACHFPEVASAGAGRVVPLEPPAIAAALLEILRDDTLRCRMGDAGRALVLSRYTWPQIARQTIDAYQRASATPPPSRGRQGRGPL